MAQALLHAGEHGLVVAGLDIDHAVGNQPCLCNRRREEIGPGQAPEHLAPGPGCHSGAEKGGRGAIDGAVAASGDLMECAECQPTAG